jgi:hypothetical protein
LHRIKQEISRHHAHEGNLKWPKEFIYLIVVKLRLKEIDHFFLVLDSKILYRRIGYMKKNVKILTHSLKTIGLITFTTWIQDALFLLGCFFYLLIKIHPVLIIESQSPAFVLNNSFFSQCIDMPGGMTDWLSAFLMQVWSSDVLASLFLACCFWLISFGTRTWIETLTPVRPVHTLHLIPAGLLLALHSQFEFHLSITIALIINLFALLLFIRWAPKQRFFRISISVSMLIVLYWLTGGAFFLFGVLVALDELFLKKQIANGLSTLFISAALPFAAYSTIVLIPLKQAYIHNMSYETSSETPLAEYCLPAFFLFTFGILFLTHVMGKQNLLHKIAAMSHTWKWSLGTVLLLTGTILLASNSLNEIKQNVLTINRSIDEERWTDVLTLTRFCTNETPLILSQSNLALYQTGYLLDSMFAYPQSKGTLGLLMNQTWSLAWPEQASNVSWRLGLVNDAQHWSHEALERKGPTSKLLRKLGIIYMLKGNHGAAQRYFLNLHDVPFQQSAAENLMRLNSHPSELIQDSACKTIQACMPLEDLISRERNPVPKLESLLKRNPKNKMAFHYLAAYYLLNGNLKEIVDRLPDFMSFDSTRFPRHIQEALIFLSATTPDLPLEVLKKMVSPQYFKRFLEYRQAYMNNAGNIQDARQLLHAQFGDTYWYYLMFVKPPSRPLESQNEYQ